MSDHDLKSQGLLSRLLVISPASAIGTRFNNSHQHQNQQQHKLDGIGQTPQKQALKTFQEKITNILSTPPTRKPDNANSFKPGVSHNLTATLPRNPAQASRSIITLNDEATGLYISYANQTERLMAQNQRHESIRGFANKLPEHATRIAATLASTEDIMTTQLTVDHLKRAIAIADFYATEALRVQDEGTTDPKLLLAEKLLGWLRTSWKEPNVSLPDIYQSSLNSIDTKAKALELVRILESHGWLRRNEGAVEVRGRVRRESWRVISGICKS